MIHVVNLKSRSDRLQWIQTELENQENVDVDVLEASTPDDVTIFETPEFYDPYNDQFIRAGEMACCLSHMRIIKKIANGNDAFGIVCEDDFHLKDKNEQLHALVQRVWDSNPFDLLYLSRKPIQFETENVVGSVVSQSTDKKYDLRLAKYSYWTLAYAISKKAAQELHDAWVQSNFTLIPIDEIYPLMCGTGVDEFKQSFPTYVNNWKSLAFHPTLGEPRETLSDTYSSPPVQTILDSSFSVVSVATEENDMTLRLRDTCLMYNLPIHIVGIGVPWNGGDLSAGPGGAHKIILLREYLETTYGGELKKHDNTIIVFVDGYDVVANLSKKKLLERYHELYSNQIVFAAERSCWPDKKLANDYPLPPNTTFPRYLNSGLFMGPVAKILQLLNDPNMIECKPGDDDQLLYTKMFLSNKYQVVLDYEQSLFQCLSMESNLVDLNHLSPWLEFNKRRPAFVHGNGGVVDKCWFERLQSYSAIGWNRVYGNYRNTKNVAKKKIFAALIVDRNTYPNEYMQRLVEMERCPDVWQIFTTVDFVENSTEMGLQISNAYLCALPKIVECKHRSHMIAVAFDAFQKSDCDYVLIYGSSVIPTTDAIDRLEQDLNELSWRSIVAPTIRKEKLGFANFWGGISSTQWYQSSTDYYSILNGKRRGVFPVPHVADFVMMKKNAAKPAYALNGYAQNIGSWMTLCRNWRKNNFTIWVDNRTQLNENEQWHFDSPLYSNYSTIYEEPGQFLAEGGYTTPILWQRNYFVNSPDRLEFPELEVEGFKHTNVWYGPLVTAKFCREVREAANRDPSRWKLVENGQVDARTGGTEHARTHDVHFKDIPYYPPAEDQTPEAVATYKKKNYMQRCIDYIMDSVVIPWSWRVLQFQLKRARLAFVVKYSMDVQRSLKWHHDASHISLDIALNNAGPGPDEFEGGGVSYDRLNFSMQHGQMGWIALHPGRVTHRHRGNPITRGIREIIVAFTE